MYLSYSSHINGWLLLGRQVEPHSSKVTAVLVTDSGRCIKMELCLFKAVTFAEVGWLATPLSDWLGSWKSMQAEGKEVGIQLAGDAEFLVFSIRHNVLIRHYSLRCNGNSSRLWQVPVETLATASGSRAAPTRPSHCQRWTSACPSQVYRASPRPFSSRLFPVPTRSTYCVVTTRLEALDIMELQLEEVLETTRLSRLVDRWVLCPSSS